MLSLGPRRVSLGFTRVAVYRRPNSRDLAPRDPKGCESH
jgi:hypothetical protein